MMLSFLIERLSYVAKCILCLIIAGGCPTISARLGSLLCLIMVGIVVLAWVLFLAMTTYDRLYYRLEPLPWSEAEPLLIRARKWAMVGVMDLCLLTPFLLFFLVELLLLYGSYQLL